MPGDLLPSREHLEKEGNISSQENINLGTGKSQAPCAMAHYRLEHNSISEHQLYFSKPLNMRLLHVC